MPRMTSACDRSPTCGPSSGHSVFQVPGSKFQVGTGCVQQCRGNLEPGTRNLELTMTPSELADQYLAGAAALRKAVAGMTREQLTARPIPGKWSTLEVVAHIADFDPVLAERMKRIIALGEVPLLLAADENMFLKAFNYHDRDVE